jgi:tryptophanyl-tRNA synthetase
LADRKRVLSGMRPSGRLHMGHLHGVLDNWLKLQEAYECFFFIADWHALTSEYADTRAIRENVREMALDWLSVGIDPLKSTIFVQSAVKEHAELHVLLSMITPLSWLERNPTHKEQLQEVRDKDLSTYGFLGYPVLQTADIIMYMADVVPVGLDQAPHLELSREITRRFNHLYGATFPEPQTLLTEAQKFLGTDGRKMSKSYNNSIYLSDEPVEIEKKMRTMVTDPARQRKTDPGNPDLCPVYLSFHKFYSDETTLDWVRKGCTTASIGCIECKTRVIPKVVERLRPIREKRAELAKDPDVVASVLEAGEEKARGRAVQTMEKARAALGLDYRK